MYLQVPLSSLQGHSPLDSESILNLERSHIKILNLIAFAKTLFLNQVIVAGMEGYVELTIYLLGGDDTTHYTDR